MPSWRSNWRSTPTCSRPGASSSPARPARSARTRRCGALIWDTEPAMEQLLQQVLAGLANGAIYALTALAVVMVYQAIDHLNFAQGEMATFSTFVAWQLLAWGMPYWATFVAAAILSFIGGVAIERILFRPLHNAPILASLVGFIALFSILNSG